MSTTTTITCLIKGTADDAARATLDAGITSYELVRDGQDDGDNRFIETMIRVPLTDTRRVYDWYNRHHNAPFPAGALLWFQIPDNRG